MRLLCLVCLGETIETLLHRSLDQLLRVLVQFPNLVLSELVWPQAYLVSVCLALVEWQDLTSFKIFRTLSSKPQGL